MHDAAEGGHGFFIGDFDEVQDDGLVRPEHRAGGDAEEEGITDLAGGAGDGHANGCFAHKIKWNASIIAAVDFTQARNGLKISQNLSWHFIFSA